MDINPQQVLNVVVLGTALASVWFWVYSLIRSLKKEDFEKWVKFILPQGILISFALHLIGII